MAGVSSLIRAVEDFNTNPVELWNLLLSAPDVNVTDSIGRSPLLIAAENKCLEHIRVLLSCPKTNVHHKDGFNRNALHCFLGGQLFSRIEDAMNGVNILIAREVDVNAKNISQDTPLHLVHRQKVEHVYALVMAILKQSRNARLDTVDGKGTSVFQKIVEKLSILREETPDEDFFLRILNEREKFIRECLVNLPPEIRKRLVNQKDALGNTVLRSYFCIQEYSFSTVEAIVDAGFDVNVSNNLGITELMYAALGRRDDVVKLLLKKGANPNAVDCFGQSVLFRITTSRSLDILCNYGLRIHDNKDRFGREPLMNTIMYYPQFTDEDWVDHDLIAPELIARGADVNCRDKYGSTPLHYMAAKGLDGHRGISILLQHGANPNLLNNSELSPLDLASQLGDLHCARMLGEAMGPSENKVSCVFEQALQLTPFGRPINQTDEPAELFLGKMLTSPRFGLSENKPRDGDVRNTILQVVQRLADSIFKADSRFESVVFPTGSSEEGTKVREPNEFDFVFVLKQFSLKCDIVQSQDLLKRSFVSVRPKCRFEEEFLPFLGAGELIDSSKVREQFERTTEQVLQKSEFWNFPDLFFWRRSEFQSKNPVLNFEVQLIGAISKEITVSVDVVPALKIPGWKPNIDEENSLSGFDSTNYQEYFILFHAPENPTAAHYARISCAPSEIHFLKESNPLYRQAYAAAKLATHFCPVLMKRGDEVLDQNLITRWQKDINDGSSVQKFVILAGHSEIREGELPSEQTVYAEVADTISWDDVDSLIEPHNHVSSYMLKNCLFHVVHKLSTTTCSKPASPPTQIQLTEMIFQYLKRSAIARKLPAFFLPTQNVFTYVNTEIMDFSEEERIRRTNQNCDLIAAVCDLVLTILSYQIV